MTPATPTDTLRVAVALVALSHKPPEQSYASYVLDLRERFPVIGSQHEDPWRERTLKLEEDLASLKAKLQKQEIELRKRDVPPQVPRPSSLSPSSPPCPPKKKAKKPKTKNGEENQAVAVTSHANAIAGVKPNIELLSLVGQYFPPIRGSLDVLGSLSSFTRELTAKPSRQKQTHDLREIIIPNARRVLQAFSSALKLVVTPKATGPPIDDLATIFISLLSTLEGLPLATQTFTELRPDFVTFVITPIMRSIISISVTITARIVTTNTKAKSTTNKSSIRPASSDIRLVLFDILRRYFALIASLKIPTLSTVEATVLHFTREIERIFQFSTATTPAPASLGVIDGNIVALSRQQRIRRLADKESFWYLCAICHSALDSLPAETPRPEESTSDLTSNAVMEGLSKLAASILKHESDNGRGLGEIERELLLAVLEKAWLRNLL
ncbi:hypothetical protein SISSUDRAFT_1125335 [Sistotremastrum suecicum HHB10207 ss-3]|uniref:Uncharacterized protein n=1 Tax=Sistotremastrum suecicum HHB10207 ss-3 TaxID=1314776 RepID=A0A166HIW2_9AGAM|nr:hypothetical protein SISSUDRAFT_1125335 [Sistotremastrum suecicum HHB10207 ss-3]